MTAVSPTQLCRLYILGMFLALWKSKTATREIIARMAATAFNPAWMDFIRSLLHFQVHGSLYTMMAKKRQRWTECSGAVFLINTRWTIWHSEHSLLWNPFLMASASPLFPASQWFLLGLFAGIFFTPNLWTKLAASQAQS